jgi:hypothetical protein
MKKIEIINKLISVVVFILILRILNIIAENLMIFYGISYSNQNVGFIFQIFISGFSAFFLVFAPSRYKLYYFLPCLILAFYSVLILCYFLLGEKGPIMFSIIYSINVMISKLMELCNKLFLVPGSRLSFLLINWIGIACYLYIVSFISFNFLLSFLTKITLRLLRSNSKT